ncbi:GAF domain-containing hybrid sensor histidine kinase/response regulator [Paraglaciecola hydrolytica]|uniref:histidine kinase n=1 Tax=Paraglaciecola hydrolytica TaxID=1799789 RepID=A0A135ZYL0_9ALTE|nr:GAF domain-containing hybrid sensor histidine kinase/response regulator [Paraglaciecola hydrolytica]KXI28051.1 histidine kinase [Paraglaciecola hydrolytica]
MQVAPPTDNEEARLKALLDYDILDTEEERVFDELAQLASEICETPIALISLVDPKRQWFKASVGLDAKETPRDIAFCAHAIHQQNLFEVEDALQDPRFFDNPLVTNKPNVRFYAGTPLITPEGLAIGTLCAIDHKPKKLNEFQANALAILGRNVISQMELRRKIKLLKEHDKNKTAFLSNMSHELRTPLNAIISFSGLLIQDENQAVDDDKLREYLRHIEYSGKRLLGVINTVLDINKIEAGMMSLDPSPCNIRNLMSRLNGILALSAQEKHLDLQTDIATDMPKMIMLDEAKFGQIVLNLVSNAIKYTPPYKSVMVSLSNRQDRLCLSVQDQGIGICHADKAKLFSPFQQVGDNKKTQGSGLGLAITKSLVELMQGNIKVQSEPQFGSTFSIELPLHLPTGNTPEPSPVDSKPLFKPQSRILVVEDNEINQVVIEAMLATYNLSATIVDSGEAALEVLQDEVFELIFMDIHLPGMNGIETSEYIRKNLSPMPIVALSADTFEHERTKNSPSVFDDFLTKPVEGDKLLAVLTQYLSQN